MIEISKIALIVLAITTNLILAIIALRKNSRNNANRALAVFALVFSFWSCSLLLYEYPVVFSSLFWIKVTYVIVIYGIIGCLYYFSFIFPEGIEKPPLIGQVIFLLSASALSTSVIFSDLFIKSVRQTAGGYETALGSAYLPFLVFCSVFGFWGLIKLVLKYRHAEGLVRSQLKFVFAGLSLFVIVVIFLDALLPIIFGDSRYFSISTAGSLLFVGSATYAIIRHRLLDIRAVTGEAIVTIIETAMMFSMFAAGTLAYWTITENPIKSGAFIVMAICAFLLVFLFPKLNSLATIIASRYFFQSVYNYQRTLHNLSVSLSAYLEMSKLVDIIINTLLQTMKLHRVAVLVRDFSDNHYRIQKTIGFNEDNGISMVKDNFLTAYLEQHPQTIVLEEIMRLIEESHDPTEKTRLQELYNHMEHVEAALIIPIMNNGRMISLIILGHKISGDPYTVQDIDLLGAISSQASIALENARLYQEVSKLNQGLQVKIDEATAQIQKKNVDLVIANEGLKSLDKMKDQLIAVASHELRTPASNVQNYLWKLTTRPKPETVLAPEDKEGLQKAYIGIQSLIKLIGDMLDVSKLEDGKMEISLQSTEYGGVTKTVIDELMPRAQKKGLSLTCALTPNILPGVLADPIKLKEVLTNLVTNAIKYTDHGGIIVAANQKDNDIIFAVKDTGRGIAQENISKLFQKFYREDTSLSASNPETGGTGLGLYITKSMVELMRGKIWVESIQGQGSIFYFSLPATNALTSPDTTSGKTFKGVFTREDYIRRKNAQGQPDGQATVSAPLPSFVVPEPASSKKKILLVEDEIEMRTFYSKFLSEKYDVDTAIDGMDGLSKLRLNRYDLVLLDIMMPRLNGVGFMQGKQQDPQLAKIPVVLLTNLGEEETLNKCFDLGAKSMIMKSDVLPDQIIPVIEKEFQTPLPAVS